MKLLNMIWEFLCDIGQARYAAELARNHRWIEAQNLYKK